MKGDVDAVAVAREGLIDGVVDDLAKHLVKALLGVVADIHAGALSDGFKPFEDLDAFCGVFPWPRFGRKGRVLCDIRIGHTRSLRAAK
ncbi:MAG: hypothetical protein AMXMBFR19_06120 [Chthonomonadaceae bacterium]|uniref:Uncharacterized protein n=1 Tax=Candidatus Nitrosymbiomonas proteolyticus TaxID=2608984 RepID=A0A809S3S2_9BACT|nr:hypothetical protein NPRO_08520 [Candidatus Nitrosymbiomonas proteolyticus]GIK31704.1 MAG: hypothetical protein BroJett009_06960 [Armatimonadota bacterium]